MRIKVEWNDNHTWKVTKEYDNKGNIISLRYKGVRFYPVEDYDGKCSDGCGNYYIGCDCCHNCVLENICKADNPINNACSEFNFRWGVSWH